MPATSVQCLPVPVPVPVPVPADIYPLNTLATTCATAPASIHAITISCPASIVPITRLLIACHLTYDAYTYTP